MTVPRVIAAVPCTASFGTFLRFHDQQRWDQPDTADSEAYAKENAERITICRGSEVRGQNLLFRIKMGIAYMVHKYFSPHMVSCCAGI